jgi:Ca-activated chloride channel family protein
LKKSIAIVFGYWQSALNYISKADCLQLKANLQKIFSKTLWNHLEACISIPNNINTNNMKAKIFLFTLLIISILANAQERKISGKVTDETGQAIAGVTVSIKNKSVGTTTDVNGKYNLTASTNDVLVFISIGYNKQEISITNKDVINVTLKINNKSLQEVTVTDYGTSMQGRVAGVQTNTKMRIRGTTSPASMEYDLHAMPAPAMPPRMAPESISDNEEYKSEKEIGFKTTDRDPQTTFSIDVDRAAYTNVRRFIMQNGQLPPQDAVRIEEMINYFDYNYAQPKGNDPINIETEISDSPWNKGLKLLHIGLQAKTIPTDNLPASNLVFLIRVLSKVFVIFA